MTCNLTPRERLIYSKIIAALPSKALPSVQLVIDPEYGATVTALIDGLKYEWELTSLSDFTDHAVDWFIQDELANGGQHVQQ